jgi:outer membrane protein
MTRIALAVLIMTLPLASMAQDPDPGDEGELMTLREAIFLALQNNLDIELARVEPLVAREVVDQAWGAFDPVASAGSEFGQTEAPVASSLEASSVASDEWGYDAGLGGILPLGLTYSSGYQLTREESSSITQNLERAWRASWRSEITLPLLRNLIQNTANVGLKRSRLAKEISEQSFAGNLTDLLLSVETAYWDLAAARAEVRVATKSLQTALDLLEQTRVQYQVGVVSKVAVTQAEAGVAAREFDEITARNRAATAQDTLLNVAMAPDSRGYLIDTILTEDPTFLDYQVDLDAAIERAMETRPEIARSRKVIEDAELQLDFAGNQILPRLDLTASYAMTGLAGKHKLNRDTIGGLFGGADPNAPAGPDLGGPERAHDDFFRDDGAHSWSIRGEIEIPIGNTTARATEIQRRIELRRAKALYRRQEQDVILEVRNSARLYHSSVEGLEAAARGRVARQETLAAEQERLRLGDSTPFQVLEFEEDLAEAERQVIFSLQIHRSAIAALDRAQGKLLERHGISIDEQLMR